jgi:aryl-alcohol dehydrogenase-like predicted oxidoreductase
VDYTTLGRTGLKASVAGLGCGGNARLGLQSGKSEAEAVALIQRALDLGVNVLDGAAAYKTEHVVGRAVKGRNRDKLILTTKASPRADGKLRPAQELVDSLDNTLRTMGQDYVDVFFFHGVPPDLYPKVRDELAPVLMREREKGKFRFIGVTETPPNDPIQAMSSQAAQDGIWDIIMMGFHMLNQKPRERLLPHVIKNNLGTLVMFVVRNIFSAPGRLQLEIKRKVDDGTLPDWLAKEKDPLSFLIHESGAQTLIDAAYRYARHEPGCNVILFGTSNIDHVQQNIESILRPPLPEADRQRLNELFGKAEGMGLDVPDRNQSIG